MGPLQGRNACRSRRSPISGLTTLSMLDNVPYIVSFTLKTSFKNDACRQKSRDCGTCRSIVVWNALNCVRPLSRAPCSENHDVMAYVIAAPCVSDFSCVEICPVNAIHPVTSDPVFVAYDQLSIEIGSASCRESVCQSV